MSSSFHGYSSQSKISQLLPTELSDGHKEVVMRHFVSVGMLAP